MPKIDNVKAFKNELRNFNFYRSVYSRYSKTLKSVEEILSSKTIDDEASEILYMLVRPFYKPYIEETHLKLEELFVKMTGVSAIRYDKLPSSANENASEQMKINMIEKYNKLLIKYNEYISIAIANLKKEISYYQKALIHIEEVLIALSPDIRKVVVEIYANGKKFEDISNGNNVFWSPSGVYLNVNKELERALGKKNE